MLNISNTLKSAALAGVLGVAAIAVGTGTAAARTYTDCDGDSCVRVHCDSFGDNCWREQAYYNPSYHDYYHDDLRLRPRHLWRLRPLFVRRVRRQLPLDSGLTGFTA